MKRAIVHRLSFAGCVALSLCCATSLQAQFGFTDNFDDDPLESGDWVINSNWVPEGGTNWVEEGSDLCIDPNTFDPFLPCTVDDNYDGYVLVTDAQGNRAGNFFRAEPDEYDNFKMTVEVELRDGSLGRPADGMTVTIVGGDSLDGGPPQRLGSGGGGMGAPCVGGVVSGDDDLLPQLTFEFDNWSCNGGDSGQVGVTGDAGGFPDGTWHHVGFSYGPQGFGCGDALPPDVFVPFRTADTPLHNQEPIDPETGKAPPNRFRMTVFAQRCGDDLTVACDLEAIDQGVNLGRLYTHVVEDYQPFEGYLGVTAATGGAWQNHIFHSASLEELPNDFCLQPAASASRTVEVDELPDSVCGDYTTGSVASVSVTLANIRQADECCTAATAGQVIETIPAGWTASAISDGGVEAGGTITWDLSGANFVEGKVLTYTVTQGGDDTAVASFGGSTSDGVGGVEVFTTGDSALEPDVPFDRCGRIKCWNILGPLGQSGGAGPSLEALAADYLNDGVQDELSFVFEPGEEISPDFFGASASTGIVPDGMNRNPGAPDTLTVFRYANAGDGWINLNDNVFGGDPNDCMAYAQIYVQSDEEREVFIASDSDDSIQIILNEQSVWINSVPRGNGNTCPNPFAPDPRADFRDVTTEPVTLFEGENRLIVKTFEGGGGFNFEIRFEDADTNEVVEGLSLSHVETNPICRTAPAVVTRDIDTGREVGGNPAWSNDDVGEDIPVTLSFSNLRTAAPPCSAAGMITIVENVPADWEASNASDGGVIGAGTVTWTVMATEGGSVSYNVSPDGAATNVSFSGQVTEAGSPSIRGVIGDDTVVYAPAPFGRGASSEPINDEFDDDDLVCPDGWTCTSGGTGTFEPGGNAAGRLQITCSDAPPADGLLELGAGATDTVGCGNDAAAVIWNEQIDLANNSFTVEFDAFLSHQDMGQQAPADGLTFVVLNADDALTSVPGVVGGAGGGNGYAGLTGFSVEFDLWQAGSDPSGYNTNGWGHIGVAVNGIVNADIQTHVDVLGPTAFPTTLGGDGFPELVQAGAEGVAIHTEIDYNNGNLQVWIEAPETNGLNGAEPAFPRTKVIDTVVTFDEINLPVLGDEPVIQNAYVGFTAATGGAVIGSEVDNVILTLFPADDVPPETGFRRGDADAVGAINLTDGVFLLNFLFLGGGAPPCADAADANDDGTLNITTGVFVFNWLFLGGPLPPAPGPGACGEDPTPDDLGCDSYDNCDV